MPLHLIVNTFCTLRVAPWFGWTLTVFTRSIAPLIPRLFPQAHLVPPDVVPRDLACITHSSPPPRSLGADTMQRPTMLLVVSLVAARAAETTYTNCGISNTLTK